LTCVECPIERRIGDDCGHDQRRNGGLGQATAGMFIPVPVAREATDGIKSKMLQITDVYKDPVRYELL